MRMCSAPPHRETGGAAFSAVDIDGSANGEKGVDKRVICGYNTSKVEQFII